MASAEDLLAEAFAAALEQWPTQGVPLNPDGWLVTVAKRRHVDLLRRGQVRVNGEPHLQMLSSEIEDASHLSGELPDRRLALMFACAHPVDREGGESPSHFAIGSWHHCQGDCLGLPRVARQHEPALGQGESAHQGKQHSIQRAGSTRNAGAIKCGARSAVRRLFDRMG